MKILHKTLAAVACLALLYALGCVGGFEAGKLSLGGLLVHCGASLSALWASLYSCSKMNKEAGQ